MRAAPASSFASLVLAILGFSPIALPAAQTVPAPPSASTNDAILAIGIVLQVTDNLAANVKRHELGSLHIEDLVFAESVELLIQQADLTEPDKRDALRKEVRNLARLIQQLHTAGDMQSQATAEVRLDLVLAAAEKVKAAFPPSILEAAAQAANQYECPSHRLVRGMPSDTCPLCGQWLQRVRLVPPFCGLSAAGRQTVEATVRTDPPLTPARPVNGTLQLRHADGTAVHPTDLRIVHTERIHLLLIDQSLTDYHHLHPTSTRTPGSYAFAFTPAKPGDYLAWVELHPEPMGRQALVRVLIPGEGNPETLPRREAVLAATREGVSGHLSFAASSVRARQSAQARLRLTTETGTPLNDLEPVMGAFAHLVGFHEDQKTLIHIHPKGREVKEEERGGPDLEFVLFAPKPGRVRLFVQIQREGREHYLPFNVVVAP